MSLVYCSTGTACCQQNSPKYAEIFYQDRIVHRCPASCNIRSPHGEFCFAKDRTVRRAVTPCLFEAVPDRKWFCAQEKLRTEPFYVLSESFCEKALRIRSGIRVFHLVAEFKEYLVQCCTRLFFSAFQRFCCLLLLSIVSVLFRLSPLQAAHRTDGSVHGLLPSPFPDTAQCGR